MKKIFLIFALMLLAVNFASAIDVNPYETVNLPQLTSSVSLDKNGLDRTYLYCTWRIDGEGEEAVMMDSEICPDPQQSYSFEDSQTYSVRIDSAEIRHNGIDWNIGEIGLVEELTVEYDLNVPEPPENLFNAILINITQTVTSWLCEWFGWFC